MMKIIKKLKIRRPGGQLALGSMRPATVSSRDPVAYAAALKALG